MAVIYPFILGLTIGLITTSALVSIQIERSRRLIAGDRRIDPLRVHVRGYRVRLCSILRSPLIFRKLHKIDKEFEIVS